jgi:hypothetical protein
MRLFPRFLLSQCNRAFTHRPDLPLPARYQVVLLLPLEYVVVGELRPGKKDENMKLLAVFTYLGGELRP